MDKKMFFVEKVLEEFKAEVPAEDRVITINDLGADSCTMFLLDKNEPELAIAMNLQNKSGARAFYEMFVLLGKMGLLPYVSFLGEKNGEKA